MTISISLPDDLRDYLEDEMQERGHESLDVCAAALLQRAQQLRPPRQTLKELRKGTDATEPTTKHTKNTKAKKRQRRRRGVME